MLVAGIVAGAAGAVTQRGVPRDAPTVQHAPTPAVALGTSHPLVATAALEGYWVWSAEIEHGSVRRAISAADITPGIGPDGWPGCPEGTLCTRYGIRALAVGARSTAHYIANVTTSSDFQFAGRIDVAEPGLARVTFAHHFSCAHPGVQSTTLDVRYLRFAQPGRDELLVAVAEFSEDGLPFPWVRPDGEPARWIAFRRVSADEFYAGVLVRVCQPEPGAPCDAACFAERLVD